MHDFTIDRVLSQTLMTRDTQSVQLASHLHASVLCRFFIYVKFELQQHESTNLMMLFTM
jgi:hypothetical protein